MAPDGKGIKSDNGEYTLDHNSDSESVTHSRICKQISPQSLKRGGASRRMKKVGFGIEIDEISRVDDKTLLPSFADDLDELQRVPAGLSRFGGDPYKVKGITSRP
jgi:hypothetical protein